MLERNRSARAMSAPMARACRATSRSDVTTVRRSARRIWSSTSLRIRSSAFSGGREKRTSTRPPPSSAPRSSLPSNTTRNRASPEPTAQESRLISFWRDSRSVRSGPGLSTGERRMRLYPSTRISRDSLIAAPPWGAAFRSAPAEGGVDDGARRAHSPAALRVDEVDRVQVAAGVRHLPIPGEPAVLGLEHRARVVESDRVAGQIAREVEPVQVERGAERAVLPLRLAAHVDRERLGPRRPYRPGGEGAAALNRTQRVGGDRRLDPGPGHAGIDGAPDVAVVPDRPAFVGAGEGDPAERDRGEVLLGPVPPPVHGAHHRA